MQFSFQQLFTFFANPWIAILATGCGLYYCWILGYILLLRDVLELKPFSAILGAGFFVANGFFIERWLLGTQIKSPFH